MNELLNDRYLSLDMASEYDFLEIAAVKTWDIGTPYEHCEPVMGDDIQPDFYSVYAHLKAGGVECIGDFGRYSRALAYAKELSAEHGWPISNFVNEVFQSC